MNKMMKIIALCLVGLTPIAYAAHTTHQQSPVGLWKTVDETTGKTNAIIQISEASDKTLVGKILKTFPQPGHAPLEFCTACEGDRHNKRIVGMVFLEKMKQNVDNKKAWSDGEILDPKNGKIYHCNLNLSDNSEKLNVRGYIGVPLFGRTQTWSRVSDSDKA